MSKIFKLPTEIQATALKVLSLGSGSSSYVADQLRGQVKSVAGVICALEKKGLITSWTQSSNFTSTVAKKIYCITERGKEVLRQIDERAKAQVPVDAPPDEMITSVRTLEFEGGATQGGDGYVVTRRVEMGPATFNEFPELKRRFGLAFPNTQLEKEDEKQTALDIWINFWFRNPNSGEKEYLELAVGDSISGSLFDSSEGTRYVEIDLKLVPELALPNTFALNRNFVLRHIELLESGKGYEWDTRDPFYNLVNAAWKRSCDSFFSKISCLVSLDSETGRVKIGLKRRWGRVFFNTGWF